MNGRILADTSVVIATFAGDPEVTGRLQRQREVFLCVPVLGELGYGALASVRVEENLARLDELARAMVVLECDRDTAVRYAAIKDRLRRRGTPLPGNVIWIAALAQQHGLTLVTGDKHFEVVEGLSLEIW